MIFFLPNCFDYGGYNDRTATVRATKAVQFFMRGVDYGRKDAAEAYGKGVEEAATETRNCSQLQD